jgi:DNA-binding transcriptional LysR family regulator
VVDRVLAAHPDIHIELNVDTGFTNIVAERFDAGVRLGENLEKDMVAVRIGPRLRMAAVAAPSYLKRCGTPKTPHDLAKHACINLRLTSSRGLYIWEFEKSGRALRIKVDGQLILNDIGLIVDAAVSGHGVAFALEDHFSAQLADGKLVRILADWCEPFDGHYLYYSGRRQQSPAFDLILEALRYKE